MLRELDGSVSRASWLRITPGSANPEADAQQEQIVEEEERSSDALERAENVPVPAVDACSDDYAALVERGRQLVTTLAELVVTTRAVRAAAWSARQKAMLTRDQSMSTRFHSQNFRSWIRSELSFI